MDTPSIALDLDGVLADTHAAAAKRSDQLNEDNCPPPDWDFESDEQRDHFLHVTQNLWHNHTHLLPPTVDNLRDVTRRLSYDYDVDIVTHRTGVDEMVQTWLDAYHVTYSDFYSTNKPKTHVGNHDIHIDDSPHVAAEATAAGRYAVVIDAEYNASYECGDLSMRVSDVSEAVDVLRGADIDSLDTPIL